MSAHGVRRPRRRRLVAVLGAGLAVVAVAAVVPALRGSGSPAEPAAATAPAAAPAVPATDGAGREPAALPGLGRIAAGATPTASHRARPHPTTPAAPGSPAGSGPAPVVTSARKGASIWKSAGMAAALRDSGVSWFYDWGPDDKGVTAPGVEFVPMIWGAGNADAGTIATAKAQSGGTLLGFNEPDLAGQAQMSVETALSLWPALQATGLRLGAPAVAYGGDTAGGWLDRFMAGAAAKGYRVDFIPLHWYGADFRPGPATDQLKAYVSAVYARYHKPIWITEYALMNFGGGAKYPTAAQESAFVTSSTAMLRGLSFVERYAWFSLSTPDEGGDGTGLYRPDGTRTAGGDAYRAAS